MIFFLILFLSIALAEEESPDLNILKNLIKKRNIKIDTSKIKVDLNKGVNMNFIVDPSKNRLSDKIISDVRIQEIKDIAKNFNVSELVDGEIVLMETTKGLIKIRLFNDVAPNHCLNFKKLCNSGFYDKTSFHQVFSDFMIQGGDILTRDKDRNNDGTGSPGWSIDAEFNDIQHKRGVLSMARSPKDVNSAGSQFFICVKDSPWLDGQYTVFGEVVDGIEVVDRISKAPTDRDLALGYSYSSIPKGEELHHDWIQIFDNDTRKEIYFKIPLGDNKTSYSDKMRKEIRSRNPYRRIEINQVRVKNEKL